MGKIRFQVWIPLVERVEVEDMVMVGLAEGDGESPMDIIVIVQEEDCSLLRVVFYHKSLKYSRDQVDDTVEVLDMCVCMMTQMFG